MMKPSSFILPLIALAISFAWIGTRRQVLAGLENEGDAMRAKIAVSHSSGLDAMSQDRVKTDVEEANDLKKLLARALELNRTGVGAAKMRAICETLTNDEILAMLVEFSRLPSADRSVLRELLAMVLVRRDPQFALDHLISSVGGREDPLANELARALGAWAKKDPQAASAWFEREVAKGTFASKRLDGLSEKRMDFESALASGLMDGDPESAAAFLATLPEDARVQRLNEYANVPIPSEKQAAFAEMVRQFSPARSAASLFKNQSRQLAYKGGYSAVSDFLIRISASPEERARCVEDAATGVLSAVAERSKVTRDDVELLRNWLETEVPDVVNKATGRALASINGMDFSDLASLVLSCQESTGSDEVLCSFLESRYRVEDEPGARVLMEKIRDPALRKKFLSRLE